MREKRIPELDGFRVLMVGIVAWYHFWQQSWLTPYLFSYSLDYVLRAGYMCVDGTILLSAFLLFLPYARTSILQTPLPAPRTFYRRRVMRILPSFYFTTFLMLFAVAIPYRMYSGAGQMLYDVFMHVVCLFTWDPRTYLGSPLGGASWTIAVEMQLYLLVPWLGRAAVKKPLAVMLGLCAVSAYFRGYCVYFMQDYAMVVNQPLSFLDVYALGMACAFGYVHMTEWLKDLNRKQKLWITVLSTLSFLLSAWLFLRVLRRQAASPSQTMIQSGQMIRRPVLALTMAGMMLSLPFCAFPIRKLFGNRVTAFLAGISMNFYLLHQNIAVQFRRWGVPYSPDPFPNQAGDRPWQYKYSMLILVSSLLAAILVTFLIEKPAAKGLERLFAGWDAGRKRKSERRQLSGKNEEDTKKTN